MAILLMFCLAAQLGDVLNVVLVRSPGASRVLQGILIPCRPSRDFGLSGLVFVSTIQLGILMLLC